MTVPDLPQLQHQPPPQKKWPPIGPSEWNSFFNEQGELQDSQRTVMHEIFTKGLHPSVRTAGWEFLMNFHPWKFYKALNETVVQNPQVMTNKEVVLTRNNINTDVIRTFVGPGKPLCQKKRIELQRVLIATYIYDRVAGYQQGLHEMGMVLQSVMKTECNVFWALRSLLQKTDYTSIIDVGVMKSIKLLEKLIMFLDPKFHTFLYANCKGDLFFLYNWFVLLFIRQMKNNTEVLRLWEVLMTRKPCPRFHVFIALAILQNRRKHILSLPQDESSIITQVPSTLNPHEDTLEN
ncbi:TBC1 domain family member 21-like [Polyodon spathula]|uniref:TBC1 domain family member 21-like n=1 Tax=Polyodon spathula TaxID=7913 RepID=UPI001B7EFBAD|nr:TBC1 domain family member 21-like [Polyodon spathula]